MKIHNCISDLVGKTPLLRLNKYSELHDLKASVLAKLEYFNPAGSVKDRVALEMINDAEKDGKLTSKSVIIEPTSGNTGIGLAAIAVSRGYKVVLTMPDTMSVERQMLLRAYGAELVLTPGAKGMAGAIEKAEELAKENPDAIIAGQFVNPSNPKAHIKTTGPEIWEDTDGRVDIFVAGIGTGGTITGVGEYLKEKNPSVKVVGIEPADSPYLTEKRSGAHGLMGIGAGFFPDVLNVDMLDEIMTVTSEQAYEVGRELAKTEGILVGISSGAALYAATEVASKPENAGKTIVVLLPDTGDRYLSTPMFGG